ncbi:MAG: hypothetical protein M3021_09025 [Actinomycetota bacterium]|nr:hypothetical protein [Actinomycetota bacterium]
MSTWCDGLDVAEAAARLRAEPGPSALRELRALCEAVIGAYARLHGCRVVHGDVHPRNLIVGPDGRVTLLDFGLAHALDSPSLPPPRQGVGFYFEPEYARARISGGSAVPATKRGEQYSVAALVYLLLTGRHYIEFYLDARLWRQIAETAPLPFARHAVSAWTAGEEVLATALRKEPDDRFPDLDVFHTKFRQACTREPAGQAQQPLPRRAHVLLNEVLRRVDRDPLSVSLQNSAVTVHSGAAGIAYMLYRLASIREDGLLLARADSWSEYSLAAGHRPMEVGTGVSTVSCGGGGTSSLYHADTGIHAVRALISLAQGDTHRAATAISTYCKAGSAVSDEIDATTGRASVLIGASSLMGALPHSAHAARQQLRELGDNLANGIASYMTNEPPMMSSTSLQWLGIAHGWAGVLYAGLLWTEASGAAVVPVTTTRLDELASLAVEAGPGLCWPQQTGFPTLRRPPTTGWCHGSAGHALLWASAYRVSGLPEYLEMAKRAALYAHDQGTATGPSLCCGLAGQAYACLSVYRLTGEPEWLRRARRLAGRAADFVLGTQNNNSLYAGDLGIAMLVADLAEPESSHMPLFELDH